MVVSPAPYRTRFRAAYVGLALAGCLVGAAFALEVRAAPQPPGPEQVALSFIRSAVQRVHPERAQTLVTADIGVDTSAADWRAGFIRVVPFPYRTVSVRLRTVERTRAHVLLAAYLRAATDAGTFLIRLERVHGRWLVSYWGPAMTLGPVAR